MSFNLVKLSNGAGCSFAVNSWQVASSDISPGQIHFSGDGVDRYLQLTTSLLLRLTDSPTPPGTMDSMDKVQQSFRRQMPMARNILISFGAFWLSVWTLTPLVWLSSKLNNKIIYGDSVLEAIAMGAMTSMGRSVGAIIAGLLVTFTVDGRKPERWAFVVAALYVIDVPVRHHWHLGPTPWDRIWQTADLLFPALACIGAAVTTRLRRETVGAMIDRVFKSDIPENRRSLVALLCVIFAFVPGLIAVVYITLGVGISNWEALLTIDLPAFLWLSLTCFYYWHVRTKSAAWLFALFPIAFAESAMHAFIWFSSTHPPR
jgi:hypothetical protein